MTPRTPGQVAREVWCNSATNDSAAHWEEIAAAVLADADPINRDLANTDQWVALRLELAEAHKRIAELEAAPRTPYGIELDEAQARIAELEAALSKIANMPHYDQDDEHRLRHLAAFAIKQPHTSPLTAIPGTP